MTNENDSKSSITRKRAVEVAFEQLSDLIAVGSQKISDVRVEELVPKLEEGRWYVVLSYDVLGEFSFQRSREFKEFEVSSQDGTVLSMKIKKI